jgi:hypothetical protein
MAESNRDLQIRLEKAVVPGFRERLLDRGLARGLIWRRGVLPSGAPFFKDSLTEDLLDYAYAVLAMALRLRAADGGAEVLTKAFLSAGESIEAAVHHGDPKRVDRGLDQVSAAVAFHLAGYAARAYSMLPTGVNGGNLSPTERVLVQLLRRSLDEMNAAVVAWLLDDEHQDERIANRLRDDIEYDETDAIHTVITTSFMRGLALFDHAITTGEAASAEEAKHRILLTAKASRDLNYVSHWWTSMMAFHLIDDLWQMSLHRQIPVTLLNDDSGGQWTILRQNYIQKLRVAKRSTIELWPSQVEAAQRAVDLKDDLVVALPTSAGKTRIAELCILRALASSQRVIYITPLRALSAQVERDLAETFLPLGISVSSLYGSAGIQSSDTETLREGNVVVSTPEKLDFALRNDSKIIDDVGLIVLDEGHMLGPSEREVRYEALVQRLLRRSDAECRRIVCLSALFPPPEEMRDFVAWLRKDEPGEAVYSNWRPTRQRFGVIRWTAGTGRLEIWVKGEGPFVPHFVKPKEPPAGSRRRNQFPHDKNELTLAAAWQFVDQGKNVLIYCTQRKSVETLGKRIIGCIKHGMLEPLRPLGQEVQDVITTGTEWLGADHPAVRCLEYGIALHHGRLPRQFLNEVEKLLRLGNIPLTIASPTLAQGLNLSASVLLVPHIWRNGEIIPADEFSNISGRAGRAFVDLEGIVLHIIWEEEQSKENMAQKNWSYLVSRAKAPAISSGLLQLTDTLFNQISNASGASKDEVIEYVTGYGDAWDLTDSQLEHVGMKQVNWERELASLDAAILALLDVSIEEEDLDIEFDSVLEGSLFTRLLAQKEQSLQLLLRRFVVARAHCIWKQTSASQRRGYHVAGVGLRAGKFLDANIANLVSLLLRSEAALIGGDPVAVADATVEFAKLAFLTEPFRPSSNMPNNWENALRGWIEGRSTLEVVSISANSKVDLLQDAFSYRLPWAMEAVRVHGMAVGQEGAEQIGGHAAMAVEVGSANRTVIKLLHSGLNSREAAITAVASTKADFIDHAGMLEWILSEEIQILSNKSNWPTSQSHHSWIQFFNLKKEGDHQKLTRHTQEVEVRWFGEAPHVEASVVIEPGAGLILTADLVMLGKLSSVLTIPRSDIVNAWVGHRSDTVVVEYFRQSAD